MLRRPGVNNWDISLQKTVPLYKERTRLLLRGEAFNIFNHTQFSGVGASFFTPGSFGRVISTKNERSLMVGMRLEF